MGENGSSKKKLFAVLEILKKYSDDAHPMNSKEILEKLSSEYDITAERKSIYRDVELLKSCGVNIEQATARRDGYYFSDREFEAAEIRLLVDAVLSASFITRKKTNKIIKKLKGQLSEHQAKDFENQIYYDKRVKFDNEQILYVTDNINGAISEHKKIKFAYYRKEIKNGKIRRKKTHDHIISPYALIWNDDKYYLVGNYDKYDTLSHYRLDRMGSIEVLDEPARPVKEVSEYKNNFDAGDYVSKTFQMYSGSDEIIELICDNSLLEKMIDKFGDKAAYNNYGEDRFYLRAEGYVSEGLADWLMSFGDKCYVQAPYRMRELIIERAEKIIALQSDRNNEFP